MKYGGAMSHRFSVFPSVPHLLLVVLGIFVANCGSDPRQPEYPLPDVAPTEDTAEAADPPATPATPALTPESVGLSGRFHGGRSDGPVGMSQDWTFTGDRYEMEGYPSIGERGRIEVLSRTGDVVRVRFTERVWCGPCETRGPDTPRDPQEVDLRFSPDGRSFEHNGLTLTRQ